MKKRVISTLILLSSFAAVLSTSTTVLTSCNKETQTTTIGIYDKITTITDTCSLSVTEDEISGKTFKENGYEHATLAGTTDGDTASFSLASGGNVSIRFYGIDTPESTMKIEKWGKFASKYVAERLESATDFILESSTGGKAETDSYGTRYLGFVWYKTSEGNWRNLNLEVVENGFSANKLLPTAKYYEYFKSAETFATTNQLHINGNDEDPYYTDSVSQVTIKDLLAEPSKYYDATQDLGTKVRIEAIITDVYISSSEAYTYTATQVIDNVEYSLDIYAGYTSTNIPSFVKIGTSYTLTGTFAEKYGNYQISGLTFTRGTTGGDYLTEVKAEQYLTFDSSIKYSTHTYYGKNLYSDAVITKAEINGNNIELEVTATQAKDTTVTKTYTFIIPNTDNVSDASSYVGKSVTGQGYQFTDGVITFMSSSKASIK